MKFRVWIQPDEDGVFTAEVPSLPDCISQGATREEALTNVREAIELYLENLEEHGEAVPPPHHRRDHRDRGLTRLPVVSGREVVRALERPATSSFVRFSRLTGASLSRITGK